jgi:mycobactin polyketide synthetase MbtD
VTPAGYSLPNGSVPVLLSSDTADLLRDEAAAVLAYARDHPDVAPRAIADMLFRTRITRRHRALAMVTDRDDLLGSLRAVIDGSEHPLLVCTSEPATARRLAYVFPGQGVQRPGMGKLFYDSIPAFRAEVDRCAEAFGSQLAQSPLNYLLDEQFPAHDRAATVQPALFTQMAGLAAAWRSFGIAPKVTIGHSQGEIAAAYVSGKITLADAVRVLGIRISAAEKIASDEYAMAVVAAGRDRCEDLLARCSGWAQVSVVNSPNMTGISGDRETVQGIVDTFTERGTFARIIRVEYPAHTSVINDLADSVRADSHRELQNPKFLDTEIDCLGSTLGAAITRDLPVDEYWFWNMRNTVRFDRAMAAALPLGIDTFVELAEHPTLQLAIQENLAVLEDNPDERAMLVVGTSHRTATDLGEFTRNLALLAVHDLDYSWDCLPTASNGPAPLPLPDFPNTRMNESRLWLPYVGATPQPPTVSAPAAATPEAPAAETIPARLLTEEWVRLSHRSLLPPRAIRITDHTGACAELVSALNAATTDVGASTDTTDFNTGVILLPPSPKLDDAAAAAEVATFFSHRTWWPGIDKAVTDCWLVTVAGEVVLADDAPPDPVHAAASAGFRSIGADHPGVRFRHLDLPGGLTTTESATAILAALHTAEEPELAHRNGGLYAKRIIAGPSDVPDADDTLPGHVLIIGGTGNLGLEFCNHFAQRGVGRITLVSRSGETAVADRLRQIRSATTTNIQVAQCDIGDQAAVSQLAAEADGVPADLIIHAAVNYSAIEFADITAEKVDQALRAKVVGISRVLGTYPRTSDCRVLLCSSARATIGGRGQVVYAAANRMLDAMAHRLRAEGLDCVSVQWGQWTVHFDLDATNMAQLAAIGVVPMSPADALGVGMSRIQRNSIVMAFDFDRARSILEAFGYGPLISELTLPPAQTPAPAAGAAAIEAGDVSQRLMSLLAKAIGVDRVDTIDTTIPMVAIGLDSLQALELHRRVKIEFDHDLEISDLLGGASIADLLARLSG